MALRVLLVEASRAKDCSESGQVKGVANFLSADSIA